MKAKPEFSEKVFQQLLTSPCPFQPTMRVALIAQCLKKCSAEDFTIPEDLRPEVAAAQKLRFAKPEEIKNALGTMSLDEIANQNLGIQQRSLDTLARLKAQGKTQPDKNADASEKHVFDVKRD